MLGIIEFIFSIIGIYGFFTENLICAIVGLVVIIICDFIDIFVTGHNPTTILLSCILAIGASIANKNPLYTFTIVLCAENFIMTTITILMITISFILSLFKKDSKEKLIENDMDKDEKVPIKKALLIIFIAIVVCISILGNIILVNKIDEQKLQIQTKDNQINILNNRISNLEEKNRENAINNLSNYRKNYFMDKYVVIIPKNTNVYHKYGCQYLDLSSCLIFNIENAKGLGYKPCSHCIVD